MFRGLCILVIALSLITTADAAESDLMKTSQSLFKPLPDSCETVRYKIFQLHVFSEAQDRNI